MLIRLHYATQMPITRTLWNPNVYNPYVMDPPVPSTRTLRNPNAHNPLRAGTLITITVLQGLVPFPSQVHRDIGSILMVFLILSSHLRLDLPSGSFLPQIGIRFLFCMHATCPAHLIVRDLVAPTTVYTCCKSWKPLFV